MRLVVEIPPTPRLIAGCKPHFCLLVFHVSVAEHAIRALPVPVPQRRIPSSVRDRKRRYLVVKPLTVVTERNHVGWDYDRRRINLADESGRQLRKAHRRLDQHRAKTQVDVSVSVRCSGGIVSVVGHVTEIRCASKQFRKIPGGNRRTVPDEALAKPHTCLATLS